jgi:O-antigen/teichoic acid export membrane protein
MKEKSSYRNIIKASSIFGGAQIIQIFIDLVRGKFVAILLGTTGVGISSLLVSSMSLLSMFSGLGLKYSAVREISKSTELNDSKSLSRTLLVYRKWLWFSALLGGLLVVIFSSNLSKLSFGNNNYTWSFIWLSIVIVLNTLNDGNIALLQGTRRIGDMAKATLIGSFIGLFSALPLYYIYGVNGIVPALIVAAFTSFLLSFYFARKVVIVKTTVTIFEAIKEGSEMAKLGVTLMIAGFLGTLTVFIIKAYVSNYGSISDVGLYQAGTSITNQYIGLVFTAMSIDYFPRLSAISTDNNKVRKMVNQQAEITILIATPLLITMILTAPILIRVLLSSEFIVINSFIRWISIGMIFKAAANAVGYISFAKGDRKVFLFLEGIASNILTVIANIIGYTVAGLPGMAISFVLVYFVYLIVICIVTYKRYSFYYSWEFIRMFVLLLFMAISVFLVLNLYDNFYGYLIATIVTCVSFVYGYSELDKRIEIREIIIKFKDKISQ